MDSAIKKAILNYANFSGVAGRKDFWLFILSTFIIELILIFIAGELSFITTFATFSLALPQTSAITRRLHDVNKSGWWQLIMITVIGIIPIIFWLTQKSAKKNRNWNINFREPYNGKNEFLELSSTGKFGWLRWSLGILNIILFWQVIGVVIYVIFTEIQSDRYDVLQVVDYIGANVMFLVGIIGIFVSVKFIHKRKLVSFFTYKESIDYNKIKLAFIIGLLIVSYKSFLLDVTITENIKFNSPDVALFIFLIFVSFLLTPFQCAFEEIFFRGYLLQGLSRKIKNIVVLSFLNGILFMLPHLLNPEPFEYGFGPYIAYMIMSGAFFSYLTIKSKGIEISIGLHTANNLFIVLILNTETSALNTPAIFTYKEVLFTYSSVFFTALSFLITYILFSTLYGWDKNIFKGKKLING